MKKILSLLIMSAFLMFESAIACAAVKPVEMPDVKFIVDNRLVKLSDVPVETGGMTLLPLRESLECLGVPADNKHIKSNAAKNSITVVNGKKTISLMLGSKTAYINGAALILDAAPIRYSGNREVYIPAGLISNIVDKQVVWDGETRSVLVRDRDKYTGMMSILNKIDNAMKNVTRVRIVSKMKLGIVKPGATMNLDVSLKEELDRKAGLLYSVTEIPLFGGNVSFSTFYKDNTEYVRDTSSNKWEKTVMDEGDFKKLLSEDVSLVTVNNMNIMAASLVKLKSPGKGEYLLSGSLYSKGFASTLGRSAGIRNVVPESYRFEAVIDERTGLVKRLHAEFSGKADSAGTKSKVTAAVDVEYKDYNGAFQVKTPDDLLS